MRETERLRLELYQPSAKKQLHDLLCTNQKVMSNALSGNVLGIEEFERLLSEEFCISQQSPFGFVTVVEKESNIIIGVSGVLECNYLNDQDIEFGFILDDQYWGKGYATEIGSYWIDFVLGELSKDRILATTNSENLSSRNVLEKLQMKVHSKINIKNRGERLLYVLGR